MTKKILLAAFALLAVGCSEQTKETARIHTPVQTLVFIDKTQSIDVSKPYIATKYQGELNNLIEQNIQGEGDKLEVYYIHENTSKARCLSMACRSSMGMIEGKNPTDIEAIKMGFDLSLKREKAIFQKQANMRLMQTNASSSNTYTDILASLEVIAKDRKSVV